MTLLFTDAELDRLASPYVARAWFLALDLPSGISRLHSGVGRVSVGGHEWRGVTDPIGGRLVSMSAVEEPAFGAAAKIDITLTGADRAFITSVRESAREIKGRPADLYWAAFDGETQEVVIGLKKLFPRGRMTSPSIRWAGPGLRTVTLGIESLWSAQNFAPGGKWNGAGQRKLYPGDKGLDFVGVKISENWA
jgi:hypothetical protein